MTNNNNNKKDSSVEEYVKNLTDQELDELLKKAMRDSGHTKFINFQGEEEDL